MLASLSLMSGHLKREHKDERALQIYKEIETVKSTKTELAYKLSNLLIENYESKKNRLELWELLPRYIQSSLKHAINTIEFEISKEEVKEIGDTRV